MIPNDTAPNIHGKLLLKVGFHGNMWIVVRLVVRTVGTADFISSKLCFISKYL
jgi:hypothetical protein